MADARDAALQFEAIKIAFGQDKNGMILKLSIHPNDVPQDLMIAPVGSRYMIVAVLLNDQDQPVVGPTKQAADAVIASAGALCRNERFQQWMHHTGKSPDISEEGAIAGIRKFCLIKSRAEFKDSPAARRMFLKLRDEFEYEYGRGNVK